MLEPVLSAQMPSAASVAGKGTGRACILQIGPGAGPGHLMQSLFSSCLMLALPDVQETAPFQEASS